MARACSSYPYYNAADTKSRTTITAWQEALGLSRQNVCFCRNFSLESITPHRPAEERSVSTPPSSCFMAPAHSCRSRGPERRTSEALTERQAALMNTPRIKMRRKCHKVLRGGVRVIVFSRSLIYATSPYALPGVPPPKYR